MRSFDWRPHVCGCQVREEAEEEEEEEEEKRALEIEFTLPPGSYATMLVRELTRECTSVMHQRSLN